MSSVPPRPDSPEGREQPSVWAPGPPPPEPPAGPSGDGSRAPAATWKPLEAIPVFVIAILLAGVTGGLAILFLHGCSVRFTVATLVGELAFAFSVIVWVRLVNRGPVAALGLPRRPLIDVAVGIGTGVALLIGGGIVLVVAQTIARHILGHAPPEAQQVQACVRGPALAYLAPVVILAAPLGEETFFRGFLYKGLRGRFSIWPAALISAAAFAAVHFAGVAFLTLIPALFVVGIGLALVYEKRQSLLASMTAHATFNLVGFLTIVLSRR
jgi:CAAX protease family protein